MKKQNQATSSVLMESDRIADRVLQQGGFSVKALIEERFGVKISKTSTPRDELIVLGEQAEQYSKRLRNSENPADEPPMAQPVYKKTVTVTLNLMGGLAKDREQAEETIKAIQAELLKREAARKNELLASPRKLDHSKQSIKLSDDALKETSSFLTGLLEAEGLKPRDLKDGVRKEMGNEDQNQRKAENGRYNTDVNNIRKTVKTFIDRSLKTLNVNQTTDALTSKLVELETALGNLKLNEANIDNTVIAINGHIKKIKDHAGEQLNEERLAKDKIYKKLSPDEKNRLLDDVTHVVVAKNIPHDTDMIEAYAKTALFKLEKVVLTPDHIKSLCQQTKEFGAMNENGPLAQKAVQADPFAENEIERAKTYQSTLLILDKGGKNAKTDGPRLFVPKNDMEALQIENMRKRGLSLVSGPGGTGKTSTAIAFMISEMEAGHIQKIILTTPMFDTGMGAMPGNELQKMGPHIRRLLKPLVKFAGKERVRNWMGLAKPAQAEPPSILDEILNDNPVQFLPLEVALGLDLPGAAIMVDEAQLMSMEDAYTISTRPGFQSQLIFCGDPQQKSRSKTDRNGQPIRDFNKYPAFETLLEKAPLYSKMTTVTRYDESHVVRSPLAQDMTKLFRQMREDFDSENGQGVPHRQHQVQAMKANGRETTHERHNGNEDDWPSNEWYLDKTIPPQTRNPSGP